MQTIPENENEGGGSRRTDLMSSVIHIGRISKCVKRKYIGRLRRRFIEI